MASPSKAVIPSASAEDRRAYLGLVQGVISRLANTSFLVKGWSVTVAGGLFAIGIGPNRWPVLALAEIMTAIFWGLDSSFLSCERAFRGLYNDVRLRPLSEIDFSMDFRRFQGRWAWFRAAKSPTLAFFYLPPLITISIFILRRG
ncbi:MAG: hypothetical protein ACRD4Q_00815 [Candidatus Acidiferrales bacterium]